MLSDGRLGATSFSFWQQSTQPDCVSFYLCKHQKGKLPGNEAELVRMSNSTYAFAALAWNPVHSSLFTFYEGACIKRFSKVYFISEQHRSTICPFCRKVTTKTQEKHFSLHLLSMQIYFTKDTSSSRISYDTDLKKLHIEVPKMTACITLPSHKSSS